MDSFDRGATGSWRGTAIRSGRWSSRGAGAYEVCGRTRGIASRTAGAGDGASVLRGVVVIAGDEGALYGRLISRPPRGTA
jgi:hypothetical protein